MRVLPIALTASFALHGAAIAWVRLRPSQDEPPPVVAQPQIEIVPAPAPEPSPMVVALLDDHSVVASTPATGARAVPTLRNQGTPTKPAFAAATRPRSEVAPAHPADPTPRNPLMTMRPSEKRALDGPSGTFLDRFVANTKPLARQDIESEAIANDLAGSEGLLRNSRWVANASPEQVAAARMSAVAARDELANRELRPDGEGTKSEHKAFRIRYAPDGSSTIKDKANVQRQGLLGGSFDITDAMMRRQGIDPYASYKLHVLDETRDERVAIGTRYRTQQLARSREYVQKNLDALWATTTDPTARKQGLFELWDDCLEDGPGSESEEQAVAGRAARAHVVGFIRTRLPRGAAGAFSDTEVAQLNARRKSRETFAPY